MSVRTRKPHPNTAIVTTCFPRHPGELAIDLPPLSAVSIYTVNEATRDSDGDGIADSLHLCPLYC